MSQVQFILSWPVNGLLKVCPGVCCESRWETILSCSAQALGKARVPFAIQACRPEEQKPWANPKVPALVDPTVCCNFLLPISLGIAWDTWENWKMDYRNIVCSTRVRWGCVGRGWGGFWKEFCSWAKKQEFGSTWITLWKRLACCVLDANVCPSIWLCN